MNIFGIRIFGGIMPMGMVGLGNILGSMVFGIVIDICGLVGMMGLVPGDEIMVGIE
jgi:hypothetical protein